MGEFRCGFWVGLIGVESCSLAVWLMEAGWVFRYRQGDLWGLGFMLWILD